MTIEAKYFAYTMCVERKIQPGAHANLKNPAFRRPYDSVSIRSKLTIPHGEVDQMRDNAVLVESHSFRTGESLSPDFHPTIWWFGCPRCSLRHAGLRRW